MQRTITITFDDDPTDSRYPDIANLAWMLARALPVKNFHVSHDGHTSSSELNQRWDTYEREATWT
ncbi:hypothetical protein [Streptomyces sp. NPDC059122]|uniref:hypothetical protein n=1 Tax=Streptomyces sp. NPDC059122 TaxID=3346732 RepID=UPI003684A373